MDMPRFRPVLPAVAQRLALATLLLLGLSAGRAEAQGLTYTLAPAARWIDWDESLGFDRTRLTGGDVRLGFGRYVGLSGYYHTAKGVRTGLGLAGLRDGSGAPLVEQDVDLRKYGGNLTLAFGTGSIVPVLSGGGGILRFAPEDGDRSTQLTLDGGAGLRLHLGETVTGEVMVERSDFRMNRYQLARGYTAGSDGTPADPDADGQWKNLSLRAGLGIQLGRRSLSGASELDDAFAQRYQSPFSGLALAVEPSVGRLQFADATGLADQDMVGLRAGLDFGSFFGLRGFYWWGTEDDFRSTIGMNVLGGEGQFALSAGPGLNPYLVAGAGRLSWSDDFRSDGGPIPEDQTSLILGGGTDFNLGPRLRLTVAARDFILSGSDVYAPQDLEEVATPDQLIHNWQFSAGLKLVVGGNGIRSAPARPAAPVTVAEAGPAEPVTPAPAAPMATPAGAAEAGTTPVVAAQPPAPVVPAPTSPASVTTAGSAMPDTADTAAPALRTITIPVPEQGEIYIRFGEGGRGFPAATSDTVPPAPGAGMTGTVLPLVTVPDSTDEATLRRIIREEIAGSARSQPGQPVDTTGAARLEAMEARILDRLERLERERDLPRSSEPVVIEVDGDRTPSAASGSDTRRIEEFRPHSGFSIDGTPQVLLGVAADIGPLRPGSDFRLLPSGAFGFGKGRPTTFLSLGLEYRLPVVLDEGGFAIRPFVGGGPTLFSRESFEAALSLEAGVLGRLGAGGRDVFVAFQGVDFFQNGRLLVGVRRMR